SFCEDEGISIRPNTDNFGLDGICDLLPGVPSVGPGKDKLLMGPLVKHLCARGYTPGVDLFGYAYDWRQIIWGDTIQQGLHSLVEKVTRDTGLPVVLIGHSMGGQVSKWYLKDHAQNVRLYVSLASPHAAMPYLGYRSLISGYNLGQPGFVLTNASIHQIQSNMASVYSLLPHPSHPLPAPMPAVYMWVNRTPESLSSEEFERARQERIETDMNDGHKEKSQVVGRRVKHGHLQRTVAKTGGSLPMSHLVTPPVDGGEGCRVAVRDMVGVSDFRRVSPKKTQLREWYKDNAAMLRETCDLVEYSTLSVSEGGWDRGVTERAPDTQGSLSHRQVSSRRLNRKVASALAGVKQSNEASATTLQHFVSETPIDRREPFQSLIGDITPPGVEGYLGFRHDIMQETTEAWEGVVSGDLATAMASSGCLYINVTGYGLATPWSMLYPCPVRVTSDGKVCREDLLSAEPLQLTVDGDGMVPAVSAEADGGLPRWKEYRVKGHHIHLCHNKALLRWLGDALEELGSMPRHDV
ncbi:lecithin:cholesterol/ phospholipid:diacylglycerol acyltransferase, partial [Kipferlia bialata]